MTLLLNLVGPSGIHLSSDFRLTDILTHRPIEDSFGSKQLPFSFDSWSAHLSFTGIAEVSGRRTLDWLSQALQSMPRSAEPAAAMANLAAVATSEFRRIPKDLRQLTMVAGVIQSGRAAALFVLSCNERPDGPPLSVPLDQFDVYEYSCDSPQVLIFGYTSAVSTADRKFLKKLNRGRLDPEEIRAALARINARSARSSTGLISGGCLVTSVLPGGIVASENFGRTPGVPVHMVGSPDVAALITKSVQGKPAFVQGREVRGKGVATLTTPSMNLSEGSTLIVQVRQQGPGSGTPLFLTDSKGDTLTMIPQPQGPLDDKTPEHEENEYEETHKGEEIGEPRTFKLLSPTVSALITGPGGLILGTVTIGGMTESVTVQKINWRKLSSIPSLFSSSLRLDMRGRRLLCHSTFRTNRPSMERSPVLGIM